MIKIKKILMISIATITAAVSLITNVSNSQWFEVIPEARNPSIGQTVTDIWVWWEVWDKYKDKSQDGSLSLWDQFASWIMTWDTILDYAVYLVKFIWQLALLVWALWIIYFGYVKATWSLSWEATPMNKLWHVVVGILAISFAYVIVKMVWSMFVS